MHRFYQPILPTSNLFLQHKWDFIDYEIHRQNVKHMRSQIDQRAPRAYPHMYIKPKQLQLEMERFCTIQRQNKFLLEKLEKIHRNGGWVDNDNTQHKPRSNNTHARQKEVVRISNENRTLLSRIKDDHTSYNRSKLEASYVMQQKYRANIDKFPREWRDMSKDMKRYRADIRERYIYPKYGKSKKMKSKILNQKTQSEPIARPGSLVEDVSSEESEIIIHFSEDVELKEEPKLPKTISQRIRNIFGRQRDKTKVKNHEEDREELDDDNTDKIEISLKDENNEVNQNKEKVEIHQDEEKNEKYQNKQEVHVDQDEEKDEADQDKKDYVNQEEESTEINENQEKDEINQERSKVNEKSEAEDDMKR